MAHNWLWNIKASRVIKSAVGGPDRMPLYFFPRKNVTKESVFKQLVGGESGKGETSLDDLAQAQDSQFGFQ